MTTPALSAPQIFHDHRIVSESDIAGAIGVSLDLLRQVVREYAEYFPAGYLFSLSNWEVLERWPDLFDEEGDLPKTTTFYTPTGAAMAAILLRAHSSPGRIGSLLRSFQPPTITPEF